MSRTKTAMFVLGACLTALSTYTSASISVQFTGITADTNGLCPGGSDGYRWSYSATISAGESTGYFTIYDLPGILCTVEPQSGSASSQLTGITPAALSPTDDSTIVNVTDKNLAGGLAGNTYLLDIILTTSTPVPLVYAWQDVTSAGVVQYGTGMLGPTAAVPEPGTIALIGLGLIGITLTRRRGAH